MRAANVLITYARQQEEAAAVAKTIHPSPATAAPPPHAHVDIGTAIAVSGGERTIGEGVPCDGDLPPCWRVSIESGGTWGAYNPHGCASGGGRGCYGPYQFGWFWGGKLGLPSDLSQATHDQWVNAARALWNHGAGCGNWSAC